MVLLSREKVSYVKIVPANSYFPPLLLFIGHRGSLHVAVIQVERVMSPEDSTLIPRSISAQSRRASVIRLWVPQGDGWCMKGLLRLWLKSNRREEQRWTSEKNGNSRGMALHGHKQSVSFQPQHGGHGTPRGHFFWTPGQVFVLKRLFQWPFSWHVVKRTVLWIEVNFMWHAYVQRQWQTFISWSIGCHRKCWCSWWCPFRILTFRPQHSHFWSRFTNRGLHVFRSFYDIITLSQHLLVFGCRTKTKGWWWLKIPFLTYCLSQSVDQIYIYICVSQVLVTWI